MVRNDELIDRTLIRRWLLWGFFWLMFAPTVGVVISTKFNYPEFFGAAAWSTFGRLRPVHVNGVIWGAFSTLFIGLAYYITPRLAGVRVWNERWGYPAALDLEPEPRRRLRRAHRLRHQPRLGGGRAVAAQRARAHASACWRSRCSS